MKKLRKNVIWFEKLSKKDVAKVGGKNASLGEMYSELSDQGVNIPNGFATTAEAFWYFLKFNNIDKKLKDIFRELNPGSIESIQKTGRLARALILNGNFPDDLETAIEKSYKTLSLEYGVSQVSVAVRSSATAEDLPSASFAGQHESYLNIKGAVELKKAVKKCMASLFTARAIAYREEKGFNHLTIALSVGVQKMVRSDKASSGVMFTLDTESGFRDVILINSIYGVGEMIVKGLITPDEFFVFKPTLKQGFKSIIVKNLGRKNKKYIYSSKGGLKEVPVAQDKQLEFSITEKEILLLSKWGMVIEDHYKLPQDIEWAKDGETGELFIVQARPETVHSNSGNSYLEYNIKTSKKPILTGIAIGNKIGQGKVRIIPEVSGIAKFKRGEVLVTKMTDPDWLPAMRLASGIITEEGGKSAHAAIVAREIGIPAIVGVENAMEILKNNQEITVDCTQGLNGRVFQGKVPFSVKKYNLKKVKKPKTKMMMNIGAPEVAFKSAQLPNDGVGLARQEFIIAEKIRVHPLALYHYDTLKDKQLKQKIDKITIEHKDKKEYFIKELAEGVAQIASAVYPKPAIVRFSDFKTNEYRNLIGGELFEAEEENPMLGFRGASRYLDKEFQPAFLMELEAIKRARTVFGLKNIKVMVPFCRTVEEGRGVLALMKKNGLKSGKDGLEIFVMCEIPSNVILADEFLDIFDGMSIGSNDLSQLMLGIDRDNAKIQHIADERNPAVKEMIKEVIRLCQVKRKYCGICGEAPSSFPDFASFLLKEKIESISLNPDTIVKTMMRLSK
ncbi:MAG: phosphoenolpyruvate synthase [Parcubacteria group bacterium]|nr:phosphoenolpyruvate synthase [Parcubacteria group bacterium]